MKDLKINRSEIISSGLNTEDMEFIYELVKNKRPKNVLEIGMSEGTSTLAICKAFKDFKMESHLTSIDPFQSSRDNNMGVKNIENNNLSKYHTLIEGYDYIILPTLLSENKSFDMIFVDGSHLYDYIMLDQFYATLLLNQNGVLIYDDYPRESTESWPLYGHGDWKKGVKLTCDFLEKNYNHFKIDESYSSSRFSSVYVKISEDNRDWNHFKDFV